LTAAVFLAVTAWAQCTTQNQAGCGSVFGPKWQPAQAYTVSLLVLDPAGHVQEVTTAGTSGASQPAWNDAGGTTADGTAVWTDEGTPNPSLGTFLADTESSFQAIRAVTSRLPQPSITASAWIVPAFDLGVSYQQFGPKLVTYMTNLAALGIKDQYVNFWGTPLVCDATWRSTFAQEVIPAGGGLTAKQILSGAPTLASDGLPACDCNASDGTQTLAFAGTTTENAPAGAGKHCVGLKDYDLMVVNANAAHLNLTLHAGWNTTNDEFIFTGFDKCPLYQNTSACLGAITLAQWEAVLIPWTQVVATRWPSGTFVDQIVLEGPESESQPWTTAMTLANVNQYIKDAATAIKTINPNTLIGASVQGESYPVPEYNYVHNWLGQTVSGVTGLTSTTYCTGTKSCLDEVYVDNFTTQSCNPSGNSYAVHLADLVTNYVKPALSNTYGGGVKKVLMSQADHPWWLPSGANPWGCTAGNSPGEPSAYLGVLDAIWESSGLMNEWLELDREWASANGLSNWSVPYCNLPFFFYTSDQNNDRCNTTGAASAAMSHLGLTDSGSFAQSVAAGWTESMRGNAHMSGNAHLGPLARDD